MNVRAGRTRHATLGRGGHTPCMATERNGARSLLATIVGYVIVAIVVLFLLNFIVGTIFWLLRMLVVIVVLLVLLTIYLRLKSPD
jgi:hypothetical protein